MRIVRIYYNRGCIRNEGKVDYPQAKFNDPNIGPNMYQVNEQLIQPLTKGAFSWRMMMRTGCAWHRIAARDAKKFSGWALMKNPEGVDIDLFVSHCWSEGVFEFEASLLAAWPNNCHAAYICFLSNPQNLDIGEMLGSGDVEQSPFCKALESPTMKQMVMIASQNKEIHTRLWCCYEAFIAMKHNIPVKIAGNATYLSTQKKNIARLEERALRAREVRTESLTQQTVIQSQLRLHLLPSIIIFSALFVWSRSKDSSFVVNFLLTLAVVGHSSAPRLSSSAFLRSGKEYEEKFVQTVLAALFSGGLVVSCVHCVPFLLVFLLSLCLCCVAVTFFNPVMCCILVLIAIFMAIRVVLRSAHLLVSFCATPWYVWTLMVAQGLEGGFCIWRSRLVQNELAESLSRVEQEENEISAQKQRTIYAVDVLQAEASNEADKRMILKAIGDQADEINQMITELIKKQQETI